ncbi:MAG TPA: hypothetical protein DEA82_01100, partial [Flavobacteriaceae bacterium]|nr:hypothetical protein [Flavobacteriaceae bacterium]
ATIELIKHAPNHMVYEASTKSTQLAVFSEMYYKNGWNAYINEKPVDHIRVNYVLRGMTVPKGNNKIEFKFEPKVVQTGNTISLVSSLLLLLVTIGGLIFAFRRKKETSTE